MLPVISLLFFLSLTIFANSAVSPVLAQSRNDLPSRMHTLEMDMQELQRRFFAPGEDSGGASTASRPGAGSEPASAAWAARTEIRLQKIEAQMRTLTGRVEQLNFALNDFSARIDTLTAAGRTPNVEATPAPAASPALPPQPTAAATPMPSPERPATKPGVLGYVRLPNASKAGTQLLANVGNQAPADPQARYKQAFDLLMKHDYATAETAFRDFVNDHGDNPLAGNALYWLGETHYVREQYADAAATFATGYEKFPDSPKTADNLVKLAMSLARMNRTDDACIALAQFNRQFPNALTTLKRQSSLEAKRIECR